MRHPDDRHRRRQTQAYWVLLYVALTVTIVVSLLLWQLLRYRHF